MNTVKIIIALTFLLLSGCVAHMQPPEWTNTAEARYAENKDYLEPRVESADSSFSEVYCLCEAYLKLYEFEKLEGCLNLLEQKIDSGDKSVMGFDMSARPYMLKSEMYIELGEYDEAITEAQNGYAYAIKEDLHRLNYIELIKLYGHAYALKGDREGAFKAIDELNAIYLGYPFSLLQEDRDRGLAKIYFALGMYDEAVEVTSKRYAFNELAKALGGLVAGSGDYFLFMDLPYKYIKYKSLLESGHIEQAKEGYDELLSMDQVSHSGSIYWNVLYDRGRIAQAENNIPTAQEYYRKAIEAIELQRGSVGNEASRIGYISSKQKVYADMIDLLVNQKLDSLALMYCERAKARALVDLLAQRSSFSPEQETAEQQQEILARLNQAEAAFYRADQRNTQNDKERQKRAIGAIRRELSSEYPELATMTTVESLEPEAIQDFIRDGETLIEYYSYEQNLYAFMVTKHEVQAIRLDSQDLTADVQAFRQAIISESDQTQALGRKLYSRLIAPLPNHRGRERLLIVGHGVLHYLPFNALIGPEGYLIDSATIRFLPSASVMRFLERRHSTQQHEILLLGNPDLGDPMFDLSGAEVEVREIKKMWPDSTVLLRESATKQSLQEAGRLFRMIHIAAHGKFQSDAPLESAILLTPTTKDDGRLSVDDLYSMELNADLVTLSACETGMGEVKGGDDVIGLSRGFLFAGARSLVTSLWPVPDRETTYLMIEFYRNLKHMSRADALREAQLKTKNEFPSPFFWAAFQLTGNSE
ncbi:CHAT domain-containing protein [Pseudodesulfovibrio sp. zrk46]|uniref:CHAT domain-containing protein n=1 Tax=Pseudodesulfovibrio sp. zrk46 TaxID=2725288 RepID=UPI001449EDBA|nr:CHAT domain-containing protein [Pseudodesulfovibrio sp. zrk46]QJB57382.1 CHAT domain-containing protein [Pseudodesulfovibrio sp. zrk46]